MALVPARYIGHHAVNLVAALGPYFNTDGTRRTKNTVETGDELMMRDREILGYTIRYVGDNAFDLGVGRRVLPEHVALSDIELALAGYEFHQGRSDFEPLTAPTPTTPDATPSVIAPPVVSAANIVVEQPSSPVNGG